MLPPALARAASIYPLGGADPATAKRWYARARLKPTKLVLYAWTIPPAVTAAQVVAFNLAQLGIEVEVKYYEPLTAVTKALMPGEPFDLVLSAWAPDYPDGAGFFVSMLSPGGAANLVHIDDPGLRGRMEAANRLSGDARRRAWADFDVDLMRDRPPWAPLIHVQSRAFVSRSLGCFVVHPIYRVDLAAVCKK